MKTAQSDQLLELYEEGLTSTEEEKVLRRSLLSHEGSKNPWFDYISIKQESIPGDLENNVWDGVTSIRRKEIRVLVSSIAATVSLLIVASAFTLFLYKNISERRETILSLEEARSLIPSYPVEKTIPNVIYEDESIIIYTEE